MINEDRFHIIIDFKKGAISIPVTLLRKLGNPDHIQLLVNPDTRTIAIACSSPEDVLAHKVTMHHSNCVLYSRSFVRVLNNLLPALDPRENYYIYGKYSSQSKCIELHLQDYGKTNHGLSLSS